MKKSIISFVLILAAIVPFSTSCEEWLEATSSSQIAGDKLFASRSGFHGALVGVYLSMAEVRMYGGFYTCIVNDMVSMPFAPSNNSDWKALQQHSYNSASIEDLTENMWLNGYKCIANINKALYELERRRDVITDELEYNLIKGELLAARAYIHFDLMRMFGLESWTGENADKFTIPYSTEYSSEAPAQHTYAQTADLIVKDIKDALECLKDDPVRGVKSEDFDLYTNSDGFWTDRQKRFNYYAAEALLARVSLWRRDFVTAGQLAADVVQGAMEHSLANWIDVDAFLEQTDWDYRDWTFSSEHIFSLEVTNLYTNVMSLYFNPSASSGILLDAGVVPGLFRSIPEWETDDLNEDVRGPAGLLKYSANGYQIYKFYGSNGYLEQYRSRMPMIKLSEMYLIMAEAALQAFDYDGALDYLDQLRSHRGISTSIKSHPTAGGAVPETKAELVASHILEEYLREMMGEGQFYYAVKRFAGEYGVNVAISGIVSSTIRLTPISVLEYPYPVSETTYGRVQDK